MADVLSRSSFNHFIAVSTSTLYTHLTLPSMLSKMRYRILLRYAAFNVEMIPASMGCIWDVALENKNGTSTLLSDNNNLSIPWGEESSAYRIIFRPGERAMYLFSLYIKSTKRTCVIQAFEITWLSSPCSTSKFFPKDLSFQNSPIKFRGNFSEPSALAQASPVILNVFF